MAQTYNSTYYSNYFKQYKATNVMYMFFSYMLLPVVKKHISAVSIHFKDLV